MPVLDGPFYDNGRINVSEVQPQSTESYMQQEDQRGFYAIPFKSQPVDAECVQYPTISQSKDVQLSCPAQHESHFRSPRDVHHPRSAPFPGGEERRGDRRVPLDYYQTQSATPLQAGQYQGNLYANNHMSDVVKFIARRELVSTGLTQFNDHPETFRAWRASFINATKDLNLSPSEEMDLLVKWLGCESAEHAKQIRAMHINPLGSKVFFGSLRCFDMP